MFLPCQKLIWNNTDEHTLFSLLPGFSSGIPAIHSGIRTLEREGRWWKLVESRVWCRLRHGTWGIHLALGGLWTQWLVPVGEERVANSGRVFGTNGRGRVDLEAGATGKKHLGWICCTSLVQEQGQRAPDAAASLWFKCSWLSEIPGSSWDLFGHYLAQGRRMHKSFRNWAEFLLSPLWKPGLESIHCGPAEQSSPPGMDTSPGDWARKTARRWFEGRHCLLEDHRLAPKQAALVPVAISLLQALLHIMQSPVWRRSEATLFFCFFKC